MTENANTPNRLSEIVKILQAPTPIRDLRFLPRDLRKDAQDPKVHRALALPYVDPRFVETRLDEACGPFGWQTKIEQIGDRMCVGLAILNPETEEWIWRWDTGDDKSAVDGKPNGGSKAAAQDDDDPGGKAIVSVGIKRCGYQFGIARDTFAIPRRRYRCEVTERGTFRKWVESPSADIESQRRTGAQSR